jgi:hypothetical protein
MFDSLAYLKGEASVPSKRQSKASRQNGAKSHGPVTPEGQAQSSKNALRHGLSASVVVLPHEDPAEFEQLRDNYIQDFHPRTQSQLDLVETLAAARWRMNRLVSMETGLFEQEMSRHDETIEKEFTGLDGAGKLAWTFNKMANTSNSLALQLRYEGQLNRTYDRAFKQLKDLQSMDQAALPPSAIMASLSPPTPPPPKPNRDCKGAVNPNSSSHLPELQNEPAETTLSPVDPPAATPSHPIEPANPEPGDEILAA